MGTSPSGEEMALLLTRILGDAMEIEGRETLVDLVGPQIIRLIHPAGGRYELRVTKKRSSR